MPIPFWLRMRKFGSSRACSSQVQVKRGVRVRGGETAQSTERQREGASERERSGERRPETQRYPSSMGSTMGTTRAVRRGGRGGLILDLQTHCALRSQLLQPHTTSHIAAAVGPVRCQRVGVSDLASSRKRSDAGRPTPNTSRINDQQRGRPGLIYLKEKIEDRRSAGWRWRWRSRSRSGALLGGCLLYTSPSPRD